jgi:hypothetical protein
MSTALPVTVTVYVPAGVPVVPPPPPPPPPPHETKPNIATTKSAVNDNPRRRAPQIHKNQTASAPLTISTIGRNTCCNLASPAEGEPSATGKALLDAVVKKVTVVVAVVLFVLTVTPAGEKRHPVFAGNPVQVKVTVPLYAPPAATVSVVVADPPAEVTVTFEGFTPNWIVNVPDTTSARDALDVL